MKTKNIKEFLIDTEILSPEQIEEVRDRIFTQGLDEEEDFLETALDLNLIKPDVAQEILSLLLAVPRIDLGKKAIDLETFSLLPEPVAREKKAVVFEKKGDQISLAVSNFDNLEELQDVLQEFNIDYFLADGQKINHQIGQYQKLLKEAWGSSLFSSLRDVPQIKNFALQSPEEIRPEHISEIADSHHAEKFIYSLLEYALQSQAEFIYFDSEEENYGIYFRIFAQRYKVMEIPTETAASIILRMKKEADLPTDPKVVKKRDLKTIEEGKFRIELNNEEHDIFLSLVQTNAGISVVLQMDKQIVFPVPWAGFNLEQQEIYFKHARRNAGLILLSADVEQETTDGLLYSTVALAEMETKKNKEIYSLTQQPVEYKIPTVNHISTQPGEKKTLLVSKIMKNRPDVILIDSITKPLLPIIMNFVSSGKKIYLTLEKDITIFLESLMEAKISKSQIVRNLSYALVHREFNKLDIKNKKEYKLTATDKKKIKIYLPEIDLKKHTFYTKKKALTKKGEVVTVRGIFELEELVDKYLKDKENNSRLRSKTQKASRRSILENIFSQNLIAEIDIKEILKWLK